MMENVQALQAISYSQQVAANNVANMNTNGFHSSRVEFETGPGRPGRAGAGRL
jgi:flagellar basal body rod protein FlgB